MNQNNNLLRIWYQKPAKDWQTEALAVGNGYMGALIFGGVKKDKIHINEKTVWNGGPSEKINYKYGNTNPADTKEELDTIKKDLDALRKNWMINQSMYLVLTAILTRRAEQIQKGKQWTG